MQSNTSPPLLAVSVFSRPIPRQGPILCLWGGVFRPAFNPSGIRVKWGPSLSISPVGHWWASFSKHAILFPLSAYGTKAPKLHTSFSDSFSSFLPILCPVYLINLTSCKEAPLMNDSFKNHLGCLHLSLVYQLLCHLAKVQFSFLIGKRKILVFLFNWNIF